MSAGPGGRAGHLLRLAAAAALLHAPAAARPEAEVVQERFQGVARGRDGAVAYLEEHLVRRAGERPLDAVTTYRTPSGEVLGVLRTDFSRDPFAPDYAFEDRRGGASEAVTVTAAGTTLVAGSRRRTLPPPAAAGRVLVAGQGLDRLVRARLGELERGGVLHVDFAIPSRQASYPFRVRALPAPAGSATLPVRVEIDAWVLRLFASALDCDYDRATGRLLRYRGLSNLRDEAGENPQVTITYQYEPAPPGPAEAAGSAAGAGEAPHAAR